MTFFVFLVCPIQKQQWVSLCNCLVDTLPYSHRVMRSLPLSAGGGGGSFRAYFFSQRVSATGTSREWLFIWYVSSFGFAIQNFHGGETLVRYADEGML